MHLIRIKSYDEGEEILIATLSHVKKLTDDDKKELWQSFTQSDYYSSEESDYFNANEFVNWLIEERGFSEPYDNVEEMIVPL